MLTPRRLALVLAVTSLLATGCGRARNASSAVTLYGLDTSVTDNNPTNPPNDGTGSGTGGTGASASTGPINLTGNWRFTGGTLYWTMAVVDTGAQVVTGTIHAYYGLNGAASDPDYGASITLTRGATNELSSVASQWYSTDGCQETFYGKWTVLTKFNPPQGQRRKTRKSSGVEYVNVCAPTRIRLSG